MPTLFILIHVLYLDLIRDEKGIDFVRVPSHAGVTFGVESAADSNMNNMKDALDGSTPLSGRLIPYSVGNHV